MSDTTNTTDFDFDVLVVGSGFGGSVTALRLTEKGYRVGVLEAGARFEDKDFAKTSFEAQKFLFRPEIGCYGIQRIDALKDCLIVSGAGVGGGSLVYANTLYEPLPAFYNDTQWSHITDWQSELAPYYDQAKRMLGVVENPLRTPADDVMEQVANDMGVGDTFHPTPVGVFFGGPGDQADQAGKTVADPYFGGAGPERTGCIGCGSCMTGCRHNAKNTLVKNYLYLAEQNGAKVLPLTTVTQVTPLDGGGYEVDVKFTKAKTKRPSARRVLTAEHVVFAASSLGTQRLLHRMRDEGHLPRLSQRLGFLSRTNSESILGAIAPDTKVDYSQGIAITSSFHPDSDTHIEPVRYGKGSNLMALMQTVLTDGDGPRPRWQTWLGEMWKQRSSVTDFYDMKHWSERTVIALVMQSLDNSLTTITKKVPFTGKRYMTTKQGHGRPEPDLDPGRQHRRPGDGQGPRRHRRRLDRRAVQPAAHRPLHRRLRDRGLPGDRGHRSLPAGLRPPRPARGRRLGDHRQPRGEPVADDHRAGRAGDVVLAEQGPARCPPRARIDVHPAAAGRTGPAGGARGGTRRPAPADRGRQLRAARDPWETV